LQQTAGTIVWNEHQMEDVWLLTIEVPRIAQRIKPGQFVQVKVNNLLDPFLRRPFSLYRTFRDEGKLQLLYKVVGKGTRLMTTLKEGTSIDLIGPLGRGFTLPHHAEKIAVVGRGIGTAPLVALADEASNKGVEVYCFLSAEEKHKLVGLKEFKEMGCELYLHADTEDNVKMVTDYLKKLLPATQFDGVYVCGSKRLTREVHNLSKKYGFMSQVSLEQIMACGHGDCHGCVVELYQDKERSKKCYKRVCKEGPVFETWEVVGVYA